MTIPPVAWDDMLEYIEFHEAGGDLEPQLDMYENEMFLETEEKIDFMSKELMRRQAESSQMVGTALNELKAMPFETGLTEQIAALQELNRTSYQAQEEVLARQEKVDQEIVQRKAERTYLQQRFNEAQRLLNSKQGVRFQGELLTLGNKLSRHLGKTPEIIIKRTGNV